MNSFNGWRRVFVGLQGKGSPPPPLANPLFVLCHIVSCHLVCFRAILAISPRSYLEA